MGSIRTKNDLYLLLKRSKTNLNNYLFLQTEILKLTKVKISEGALKSLELSLRYFCNNLHKKWVSASYNEIRFLNKHDTWLMQNYILPEDFASEIRIKNVSPNRGSNLNETKFNNYSDRHKNRITESLRNNYSSDELLHAAKFKCKTESKNDMASILNYLIENPSEANRIKKTCEKNSIYLDTLSKNKALGMIISLKLSKYQYSTLRNSLLKDGINYYPSYYKIQQAKNDCYPAKESIHVTSSGAKIQLQALLDHTVSRILLTVQKNQNEIVYKKLVLISKWGCDGASGQSNYKQIDSNNTFENDSGIFIISLVPIKLYDLNTDEVIWENDRPSSTHFCHPIKFEFVKEN
ncbi:unnamed protein product [Macrosiphum euphorbiae]|uniref:Uncharacterized protein n=1 Tax=Macrosiphum euphorbiae TaxID=13131 RepID=A0AAV0XFC8_9HEMI|nr:unnamed protein product [Macrosiphum euphorbiae]